MEKKRKTGLPRLLEIAGKRKMLLIVSMGLCSLSIVGQFTPIVASYLIIEHLAKHVSDIQSVDQKYLMNLGYVSLIGIFVYGLLQYFGMMASHIGAFNIIAETRTALGRKMVKLPLGQYTNRSSGEMRKIITDDTEQIESWIAHYIPDIASGIAMLMVTIGYLFFIDWRLAIAALIPFPVAFAIQASMMSSKDAKKRLAEYTEALEKMNGTIVEFVRGMEVIKVFNRSLSSFSRYREDIFNLRDSMYSWMNEVKNPYAGFLTIISSSLLFVLLCGTWILFRGADFNTFAPVMFLFMILATALAIPLYKLMFVGGVLNRISEGVTRIDSILYAEEISDNHSPVFFTGRNISFENVKFSYGSTDVLRGISFTAEADSITALVGPSGGGKSTIAHLIPRFWDVKDGSIKIGKRDIRQFPTSQLMDLVSFVFQEQYIFAETIEYNIRMGNSEVSQEQVENAAKAANIHNFILTQPKGYQTKIGAEGTYLSGGEQQRISLARAILKDAPIIILDEATAYADPENESLILDSFSKLIAGKTVIVIAHRLSTVVDADKIIVINKGVASEEGRHEELLEQEGIYWNMWNHYNQAQKWILSREERV